MERLGDGLPLASSIRRRRGSSSVGATAAVAARFGAAFVVAGLLLFLVAVLRLVPSAVFVAPLPRLRVRPPLTDLGSFGMESSLSPGSGAEIQAAGPTAD